MRGWKLTILVSLALLALTGLQLLIWGAVWGMGEESVRVVVRSSARSSLLLFALAFSASAIHSLSRGPASKWLLANRRYIGVSYAVSHTVHAAALVALYRISTEFSESLGTLTLIGGGLAYVFTYAMAATSNDAAVRALGRPGWRRLHLVGGWYVWIIFAQSYLPRAAFSESMDPIYLLAGAVVLAVPALRIAARMRRRTAQPQAA